METDPKIPPFENHPRNDGASPPLPGYEPPASQPPHPLAGVPPPPAPPHSNPKSMTGRKLLAVLLSLCIGLFVAEAIVSLVADSVSFVSDTQVLLAINSVLFFFAALTALVVYVLMGLTPMIPKRLFLPLTLFYPIAELVVIPFMIYFYGRLQLVGWGISLCQVVIGLGILYCVQGGFKLRWPFFRAGQLESRPFSGRNLILFLAANVLVLLPAALVYLVVCAALATDHFSEGFLVMRPAGLTVRVRKYVRKDGKTIQLFPMLHVAESDFYKKVLQSFPTNSIILMEGVTDNKNLLTNKITYKRMAATLGLGEQHQEFKPPQAEVVRADVDVDQFTTNTISVLNLAMFIHAKGLNPETLLMLLQFKEPPDLQDELFNDLLTKRNQHLLEEIRARLSQPGEIIVPWGAAHMPGLAKEIQKSGFHLEETQDYVAIRFHGHGNDGSAEIPK